MKKKRRAAGSSMLCDIMIIRINKIKKTSARVQEILTEFGCHIKVRVGLHDTNGVCSEEGIIILQLAKNAEESYRLEVALNSLDGVKAQLVILEETLT